MKPHGGSEDDTMMMSTPPTGPAITVLHLSDLQFGKYHRFGRVSDGGDSLSTLAQRLCDDLDLLRREYGLAPDLIALTGDLSEWGKKRELDDVRELCICL